MSTEDEIRARISELEPTIYDPPAAPDSGLYYTASQIEALLRRSLIGASDLDALPLRTRSKAAKALVCEALGYRAPAVFRRTQPRLMHPDLDVYVQESSNLQVWNEAVDATRRYVILVLRSGLIRDVHVIAGADLAQFDSTGTLTRKYQARRIQDRDGAVLVSPRDTVTLVSEYLPGVDLPAATSPVEPPSRGRILDIATTFALLAPMVGRSYVDPGATQERNRGTVVHRETCERLGLSRFADNGQFPDVLSQLLEVKLQLAPTVDLGLATPDSDSALASVDGRVRVRDCRYAVFYAERTGPRSFEITALVMVTGRDFFTEFRQFAGNVTNSKLQLRLPREWFR